MQPWTQTFYSVAIVQSALITGLMAFRVWQVERRSAKYRTSEGKLMPIIRLLMESAALLLVVEVILLGMYTANYNAQYILLELVAAIVVSSLPRLSKACDLHNSMIGNHYPLHFVHLRTI